MLFGLIENISQSHREDWLPTHVTILLKYLLVVVVVVLCGVVVVGVVVVLCCCVSACCCGGCCWCSVAVAKVRKVLKGLDHSLFPLSSHRPI